MYMVIGAIAIALGTGYLWLIRGFFSALIHLACTIAAGAIAFGVWEPVAYLLLGSGPGFLSGAAFAIGLIVPFAASLAVLRLVVDKSLPKNAQADKITDAVGGGLCGVLSGTITAGILVIGLGTQWLPQDWMGYNRLDFNQSTKTMERGSGLFDSARVDDAVEIVYSALSTSVFSPNPDNSLARLYPNLADVPASIRMTTEEGRGKNFLRPDEVSLVGAFTVGLDADGNPIEGATAISIMTDAFNPERPQLLDRTGENIGQDGGFAAGYVLRFDPGAREQDSGQVALTAAQARLVVENARTGDVLELFPYAVITRRDPANDEDDNASVEWGRYVVDDGPLASVAGENNPVMMPEFWVPSGYEPVALYIKNLRLPADVDDALRYASSSARQAAIVTGTIAAAGRIEIDESDAITWTPTLETPRDHGIFMADIIPGRISFLNGTVDDLSTDDERRILSGEARISRDAASPRGVPRELVITSYQTTRGASLIHFLLTENNQTRDEDLAVRLSQQPLLDASRDEQIFLVDESGVTYPCIGFVYADNQRVVLRYTRDNPLDGLSDLPSLPSRSRTGQEIYLTFEATTDARIVGFVIGDRLMVRFATPLISGDRDFPEN